MVLANVFLCFTKILFFKTKNLCKLNHLLKKKTLAHKRKADSDKSSFSTPEVLPGLSVRNIIVKYRPQDAE